MLIYILAGGIFWCDWGWLVFLLVFCFVGGGIDGGGRCYASLFNIFAYSNHLISSNVVTSFHFSRNGDLIFLTSYPKLSHRLNIYLFIYFQKVYCIVDTTLTLIASILLLTINFGFTIYKFGLSFLFIILVPCYYIHIDSIAIVSVYFYICVYMIKSDLKGVIEYLNVFLLIQLV